MDLTQTRKPGRRVFEDDFLVPGLGINLTNDEVDKVRNLYSASQAGPDWRTATPPYRSKGLAELDEASRRPPVPSLDDYLSQYDSTADQAAKARRRTAEYMQSDEYNQAMAGKRPSWKRGLGALAMGALAGGLSNPLRWQDPFAAGASASDQIVGGWQERYRTRAKNKLAGLLHEEGAAQQEAQAALGRLSARMGVEQHGAQKRYYEARAAEDEAQAAQRRAQIEMAPLAAEFERARRLWEAAKSPGEKIALLQSGAGAYLGISDPGSYIQALQKEAASQGTQIIRGEGPNGEMRLIEVPKGGQPRVLQVPGGIFNAGFAASKNNLNAATAPLAEARMIANQIARAKAVEAAADNLLNSVVNKWGAGQFILPIDKNLTPAEKAAELLKNRNLPKEARAEIESALESARQHKEYANQLQLGVGYAGAALAPPGQVGAAAAPQPTPQQAPKPTQAPPQQVPKPPQAAPPARTAPAAASAPPQPPQAPPARPAGAPGSSVQPPQTPPESPAPRTHPVPSAAVPAAPPTPSSPVRQQANQQQRASNAVSTQAPGAYSGDQHRIAAARLAALESRGPMDLVSRVLFRAHGYPESEALRVAGLIGRPEELSTPQGRLLAMHKLMRDPELQKKGINEKEAARILHSVATAFDALRGEL